MKQTPLFHLHVENGAKMGAFAGYDMPLFYPLGVMREHQHTRSAAGLFDISHMLHVEVTGKQAAALVSRLCPYNAVEQEIGACKYTFFLTDDAGIIDDLIITRLDPERFLIVCNAGRAEKDEAHIRATADRFDARVTSIPRGFLALQGPKAEAVLVDQGFDVAHLGFMEALEPREGWFISRTGYTGEDGFEIALPHDETREFAEKLAGDVRVEWVGLGARDSLRLEAGLSLYGQDLDENTTPHEAGLLWAIPKSLREGGDFIGADALAARIAEGRTRMRVGVKPEGRPVRAGTDIVTEGGEKVGTITSGGFGPTLGGPMALGLIDIAAKDAPLFADMRGKPVALERATLPFVPHSYKR